MKVIYSKNGRKIDGVDGCYADPSFFLKVNSKATSVIVSIDEKKIISAYEEAGVQVVFLEDSNEDDLSKSLTVAEIKEKLEILGIEFSSSAKKPELLGLLNNQQLTEDSNEDDPES